VNAEKQDRVQGREKLRGVVERVTYHNPDNGWSVLRVRPFSGTGDLVTVTVHQGRVFAGATMEFKGTWTVHPRFGRQFKATEAVELKPATEAALEKYLGSGLIKGVGPKTARKIVRHFGRKTLEVFESDMDRLLEVPGIAAKKLAAIRSAWLEHRAVRDVVLFLQSHGVSTLFAVRIFKKYGKEAIALVSRDPYRLARDFYGIGFFSADRIALSLGFAHDSPLRMRAAIAHVLNAAREQGHCYLTGEQVEEDVAALLRETVDSDRKKIDTLLEEMTSSGELFVRSIFLEGREVSCFYSPSLYRDETYVARWIHGHCRSLPLDKGSKTWLTDFGRQGGCLLSGEQEEAVLGIATQALSILTGGPGCGKTTTTRALVGLLASRGRRVILAAPTGRAAQRMSEVIGREAKTIHRLLEFTGHGFGRDRENPLQCDVLIVDECSMLDIPLAAALLRAVAADTQLVLIGDPDQLPPVGAGQFFADLLTSEKVPVYRLTRIFRQASRSLIIRAAHEINRGRLPRIGSPFRHPSLWRESDCLFLDSEEATVRQLAVIRRIKQFYRTEQEREKVAAADPYIPPEAEGTQDGLDLPDGFEHVDPERIRTAESHADQLLAVLKKVHPWSSLYYGLTASDVLRLLVTRWIPRYLPDAEIQVLTPMTRGTLGAYRLNGLIQAAVNPGGDGVPELVLGERLFRVGDRVIHRRNNYDLEVFNGDIGRIVRVDPGLPGLAVSYPPEGRVVEYRHEQLAELDLAYAVTVHKAQGSEFDVVVLPVVTQHYRMLARNLFYTGLTRAKKMAILVGSRRALAMAVSNHRASARQTLLAPLLTGTVPL